MIFIFVHPLLVWGICTGSMNNVRTTHPPSLRSGTLPGLGGLKRQHADGFEKIMLSVIREGGFTFASWHIWGSLIKGTREK